MKKDKPAIYEGPLGWGWVLLRELAEITGYHSGDLVDWFFYLAKDARQGGLAIALEEDYPKGASWNDLPRYIDADGYEQSKKKDHRLRVQDGTIFVPAGWANQVMKNAGSKRR